MKEFNFEDEKFLSFNTNNLEILKYSLLTLNNKITEPINNIYSLLQLLKSKNSIDKNNMIMLFNNINSLLITKNNIIYFLEDSFNCLEINPRNYDIISTFENLCDNINNSKSFRNINIKFSSNLPKKIISFDKKLITIIIKNLMYLIDEDISLKIICKKNIYIYLTPLREYKPINNYFYEDSNNKFTNIPEYLTIEFKLIKDLLELHNGNIITENNNYIIVLPNIKS